LLGAIYFKNNFLDYKLLSFLAAVYYLDKEKTAKIG